MKGTTEVHATQVGDAMPEEWGLGGSIDIEDKKIPNYMRGESSLSRAQIMASEDLEIAWEALRDDGLLSSYDEML